jgi:ketosteroid isomerase-like protein
MLHKSWIIASAIAVLPTAGAAFQQRDGDSEASFREFLPRFERGLTNFVNGRPAELISYCSLADDATLMGGWGAYERGRQQLEPRFAWAASQFQENGAKVAIEYLSTKVSGDLAYTVSIERMTVRLTAKPAPMSMALRVTHVFGLENGAWKLLHRHADSFTEKQDPGKTPAQ